MEEGPFKGCKKLSTKFLFRRWSGSIPGYNLLRYCLDESVPRVPNNLDGSFYIVQVIRRVRFRIVVSVQDFFYRRDKRSRFKDLLDQLRYESKNPFLKELWDYIFDKLKKKSGEADSIEAIQSICSARGERVIQKVLESLKANVDANKVAAQLESLKPYVDPNTVSEQLKSLKPYVDVDEVAAQLKSMKANVDANEVAQLESLKANVDSIKVAAQFENLKPFVDPNEVTFDETLLSWHIATDLCYTKGAQVEGHKREISMLLSDYMLYLLVMQPNMMSAIAGIGQKRFQDTCEEAKKFFKKRISASGDWKAVVEEAYKTLKKVPTEQKPSDVKGDRSKSLLFDACRLAKELDKLPNEDEKWEIITSVWVELLSYAACHCRPTGHLQLLSKGGQLISFVWLLMVQLGLGTQFQIKEGDARAKLIVGKFA